MKNIEFEDERVKFDQWASMKPTTKFGQLPLMTLPDGTVLAQSDAMLRFVARLPGSEELMPTDPIEALRVDEAMGLAADMDKAWTNPLYIGMRPQFCGYPEDYQKTEEGKALVMKMRQKFLAEELPKFMQFYVDFMGENDFFCGSKITSKLMIMRTFEAFLLILEIKLALHL